MLISLSLQERVHLIDAVSICFKLKLNLMQLLVASEPERQVQFLCCSDNVLCDLLLLRFHLVRCCHLKYLQFFVQSLVWLFEPKKHLEIKDARRAPRPIYKSAGIGNAALAVWGACIYGPPDVPYMKLMRFQSSLIQGVEIMERATL